MTALRRHRAPVLAGLAPLLLLLLLLPVPLPASAAPIPPTPGENARETDHGSEQPQVTYVVKAGDTLSAIARRYGTRVAALLLANRMG